MKVTPFQMQNHLNNAVTLGDKIVWTILLKVYGPAVKILETQLKGIIKENSSRNHNQHLCFSYRGRTYGSEFYFGKGTIPKKRNGLHPDYHERFSAYLNEMDELENKEVPFVHGYLAACFLNTFHWPAMQGYFPVTLHSLITNVLTTYRIPVDSEYVIPEKTFNAFMNRHQKYYDMLRLRMARNLVEF